MCTDPPTSISFVTIALSVTLLPRRLASAAAHQLNKGCFLSGGRRVPAFLHTPPHTPSELQSWIQAPGSSTCYAIAASLASENIWHKSMTPLVTHPGKRERPVVVHS